MITVVKSILRKPARAMKEKIRHFRRARIAKKFLKGSGIEIGALHAPLAVSTGVEVKYVDRLSLTDLLEHYPHLKGVKVVDPSIVDSGETLTKVPDNSIDFIVANHFIEHCEDPIGTLKVFLRKLKDGGIVFLAVPDKRYTFDHLRPLTTFSHLLNVNTQGPEAFREKSYSEFVALAHFQGKATSEEVKSLAEKLNREKYSIHFHAWSADSFRSFLLDFQKNIDSSLAVLKHDMIFDEGIFILGKNISERPGRTHD